MNLPDTLRCLFTSEVEERDGSYLVEVPKRELDIGHLDEETVYRVAVLESTDTSDFDISPSASSPQKGTEVRTEDIEAGDVYVVEIEDIGDQGDGLARLGEGYVVFVPGTEIGDEISVKITEARETVAFATPIS